MYDLIGDIHGYADALKHLLEKLGYSFHGNHYKHPERKVIFVGDFIDRGKQIRETLKIVRSMVDNETALAVKHNKSNISCVIASLNFSVNRNHTKLYIVKS